MLIRPFAATASRAGCSNHAEDVCRAAGTPVLTLSTSELQEAALAFYRAADTPWCAKKPRLPRATRRSVAISGAIISRRISCTSGCNDLVGRAKLVPACGDEACPPTSHAGTAQPDGAKRRSGYAFAALLSRRESNRDYTSQRDRLAIPVP